VRGSIDRNDDENGEFLYRGIAERDFERRFQLADHVKVKGARLQNGLLHVDLEREIPEEKKPRRIAIESGEGRLIEASNDTEASEPKTTKVKAA
jgi:molecular chaperone IbpA